MQLRQLEYFVSLCETLNFTRTAEEFYVSQTAVTHQIKALEEELHAQLFDRTRRSVTLTAAGRLLYEDARSIVRHVQETESRLKTFSNGVTGTLRIGFLRGYEHEGLSDALHTFHEWMPRAQLFLQRGSFSELKRLLRSGQADVIFTHRVWESHPDYEIWPIRSYPLMLVCTQDHPLADYSAIRPENLAGYRAVWPIHSADEDGEETIVNRFYRDAGVQPEIVFQSHDIGTNLLAAAAGLGYMLAPSYITDHLDPGMRLAVRPVLGHEEEMTVAAVWPRSGSNPLIPKLLDICAAKLKR